jgi:hypothetical protein
VSTIHVYCDESAHLEHDRLRWMVLGAIWCPGDVVHESAERLREIKARHGLAGFEVKWTKVGPAKLQLYQDVLDYFFDDDDLCYRAVVIDKEQLDPAGVGQDHDDWYYQMWFTLLLPLIHPDRRHRIYLDIKDTRSQHKVDKLREALCTSRFDFRGELIERIQQVRSHEVQHVQLADLLTGAVAGANRGDLTSPAKRSLIERMQSRSHLTLTRSTLVRATKVNLLHWVGRGPS